MAPGPCPASRASVRSAATDHLRVSFVLTESPIKEDASGDGARLCRRVGQTPSDEGSTSRRKANWLVAGLGNHTSSVGYGMKVKYAALCALMATSCYQTSTSDGRTVRTNRVTGRSEVLARGYDGKPAWREIHEATPTFAPTAARQDQSQRTPAPNLVELPTRQLQSRREALPSSEMRSVAVHCEDSLCTVANRSTWILDHVVLTDGRAWATLRTNNLQPGTRVSVAAPAISAGAWVQSVHGYRF